AEAGVLLQSGKEARTKCLDLIDQLDTPRHALRDALAELQHLYKLLSKKLPDDNRVGFNGLEKADPASASCRSPARALKRSTTGSASSRSSKWAASCNERVSRRRSSIRRDDTSAAPRVRNSVSRTSNAP